jgi:hypothetical protein
MSLPPVLKAGSSGNYLFIKYFKIIFFNKKKYANNLERYGTIWNDMERYGTIWNDMERYGT